MDLEETVLEVVVLIRVGGSCKHDNDLTGVSWSDMANIHTVPLLHYLCAILYRV